MSGKIGFFGAGSMGKAIIKSLIHAGYYNPADILVYDAYKPTLESIQAELGVTACQCENDVAKQSEILVVAVKPGIVPALLSKIKGDIAPETILTSIAAGVTVGEMEQNLAPKAKVVGVMTNTPAMVKEGMTALCFNAQITKEDEEKLYRVFSSFGKVEPLDEKLMGAFIGVSGSSPAYVYMFIEALADGAVMAGMSRKQAITAAAQTVLGSAKMVLETGIHPDELKDMVCSPGGITIAAVKDLEKNGFRHAAMSAVLVCADMTNC